MLPLRALEEKRARLGLVECVNHELLQPYPVLHEKPGLYSLSDSHSSVLQYFMVKFIFSYRFYPNQSVSFASKMLEAVSLCFLYV